MSEPKTDEVRVVPVEPTEAMYEAAERAGGAIAGSDLHHEEATRLVYQAMLAAAPPAAPGEDPASPPAETGEGEDLDLYDDKVQLAISWTMRQWGEALGLKTWTQGDGSESVEGDVGVEIFTMLADAGLYNQDDGTFAKLAQPVSPSEGEASFRDIFLSWHEECGTVEVAGPCATPIGKFEARWPDLRKRLWSAALKNAEALKNEWVKIAKECAK